MITIRRAAEHDARAMQGILNEVIEDGMAFVAEDAQNLEAVRAMWLTPPVEAFVACDATRGNEIVGAYLLKSNFPGRGAHVANATYMVKRNQHGRGIGRMLGVHSLQQARQAGYRAMQFNAVVSVNHAAVALWEGLGFARIGTVPRGFRLADGHYIDLYIMYQSLEGTLEEKLEGNVAT